MILAVLRKSFQVLPLSLKGALSRSIILSVISSLLESALVVLLSPLVYFAFNHPIRNVSTHSIVVPLLYAVFAIFVAAFRTKNIEIQLSLSNNIGIYLSDEIFRRSLMASPDSSPSISRTISLATNDTTVVVYLYQAFQSIFLNSLTVLFVAATLFLNAPFLTLIAIIFVLLFYASLSFLIRPRLTKAGIRQTSSYQDSIRIAQDALLSKPFLLTSSRPLAFASEFAELVSQYRKATALINFLAQAPRYIIESLTLVIILLYFVLSISTTTDIDNLIASIATVVVGLYKILQPCQQIFSALATVKANSASLSTITTYLSTLYEYKKPNATVAHTKNPFNVIEISDLHFSYDENPLLSNINLIVKPGEKVVISGPSGSGKSTLSKIILNFLVANSGSIRYCQSSRYSHLFSYIPQSPFLVTGTLLHNVTLSPTIEDVDYKHLNKCISLSGLSSFVDSLPNHLSTQITESSANISGGQIQRICIARALYQQSQIIIMDEPSSSLDMSTERSILDALLSLDTDQSVIIISHSSYAITRPVTQYRISNGTLVPFSKSHS